MSPARSRRKFPSRCKGERYDRHRLCGQKLGHRKGGAQLYRALLPRCERVLVTQVDAAAEGADAFFPNLDAAPDWTAETVGEWQEENGLRFRYVDYVRRT